MTARRRLVSALLLGASLLASPAPADSRVDDQGSSLFETTEAELETRLDAMAERTGVDVYVVVVRNLEGATASEVARAQPVWDRPGRQLLLLIAMAERQVRIETDEDLAADHSDAAWSRLIETEMLAALRAGRQGTATRLGLDAIEAELLGEPPSLLSVPRGSFDALRDTLFVLVAGLLGGLSLNRMRRERVWRARW
jgi:uncharacterized membrane protein YgcG